MISELKKNAAYKFLNRFNDLETIIKNDRVYYIDKDGETLFYYRQYGKNKYIWFSYDRIWLFFEDFMLMNDVEIEYLLNNWVEDTYNLRGFTPRITIL